MNKTDREIVDLINYGYFRQALDRKDVPDRVIDRMIEILSEKLD